MKKRSQPVAADVRRRTRPPLSIHPPPHVGGYAKYERGHVQTLVAIQRGLESMERGEGRPARAVFARLRRKHGVPRAA